MYLSFVTKNVFLKLKIFFLFAHFQILKPFVGKNAEHMKSVTHIFSVAKK